MKSHFSLSALALAHVVATGLAVSVPAVSFAQSAEPAPGAPPAVAPLPDQSAPPAVSEEPAPLIWRGTTFTWTHTLQATTAGLGTDQISYENDYYAWDFVLNPQIFILDLPNDKISASVEAGVSVEMTNSDTTTKLREPLFRDTQVGLAYSRNIFTSDNKEWSTKGGLRLRYVIPTSNISLEQGRFGVLSAGISFTQVFPILGNAAAGLNNLTVAAGLTYSHLFSRSYNPTNPNLERTRQNLSGQGRADDQLSFRSFDVDRLIPSGTFTLPLYKDLSLSTTFRLISRFRHEFEGTTCVETLTGCAEPDRLDNPATYFTDTSWDISLTQPVYDMFAVALGYNNETLSLGEDGKTRDFFYSPSAVFYLDLVANIDAVYEKASGRSKFETPPGPRTVASANEYGNTAF